MRCSVAIAFALSASAIAAPTLNHVEGVAERSAVDNYFNEVSKAVAAVKRAGSPLPVYDLSKAQMPAAPVPLPDPSAGTTLKHVAIGRGTQNYTCGTNSTAAPTAIGAVADLFNATEVAAMYPEILATMPSTALQFNLTTKVNTTVSKTLTPMNLQLSGHHFFTNTTNPFFNLDASDIQIGQTGTTKLNSTAAPTGSMKGVNNVGDGAVPWLKLSARSDATGGLAEVYRLNTAGGNPPATCAGKESSTFTVQYAAEYWFWQK